MHPIMSMKKLMEMEEKVTIDSHYIGLERSHSREKEDAKENGIMNKMNDEEYDIEKVEIRIHQDLLMELLKRGKEEHKCGWFMKKYMKWHRL